MKNKFKKSKIIVPALALITATTAASVTGTVAWFTATRAVTVTASNFVATKLESKLSVSCADGVGTTASDQTVTVNGNLTHGSYNAQAITTTAAGNLYVAKLSDTVNSNGDYDILSYDDLGTEADAQKGGTTISNNKWLARTVTDAGKTTSIYYGVSWTMTFKLDSATTGQTDYLIFDPTDSNFDTTNPTSGTSTAPGIRIALMTASQCIVLGNDSVVTHTTGTLSTNTGSFANYVNLGATHTVTKLTDDSSDINGSNYTLGTVDTTGLKVTCVAWYEGSDTNVVDKIGSNDVIMSTVTSTLAFYTRYVRG